ncbi:MAG: N-acetylmuramoyl-L-alanine amidase [Candidatus Dormibacteraeota bacterium]|uniref:N-acetylmuramoyl-L-alanine amidase n=1 Tax=Candidatus Amunia macphersoniae TaxID=3127014 RepID=A0A934NAF2_9BACT|nr:N-acetylmuramoyl-L-alanine amidase [Candidatus Dormibacteraeota bacterium]
MRHPATRLLHVLLSVPVLIAMVITASPTARAQSQPSPAPLVIVIDPGHGGAVNPAQPDMPFDPGAIAPSNGLQEKDATLAVSKRVQALLEQDAVHVVLTRSDDRAMSIQQRTDTANSNQAAVFVSIHFNSYPDGGPGGSLVLYPKDTDITFANRMSDAMNTYLGPLGVADDGVQLRDNWWVSTQMPTVTVEPAFLSNAREASLIASPDFQQALAMSIRAGIETYDPQVLQRKAQITAWNNAHPERPVVPATVVATPAPHQPGSGWLSTVIRDVLLLALLAAVVRWPHIAWRTVRALYRLALMTVEHILIRRAAGRRRRRALAVRSTSLRAQALVRPHHIYDELY